MPLMREWVEITVDEDLLIPVVRELLDMAVNANQVEVTHGERGRIILAEVHLAEHWYQERLKRDNANGIPKDDFAVQAQTEVVASADVEPSAPVSVAAPTVASTEVEPSTRMPVVIPPTSTLAPRRAPVVAQSPARRAPAPKPSASPNGEDL